jgi:hypothetical protein
MVIGPDMTSPIAWLLLPVWNVWGEQPAKKRNPSAGTKCLCLTAAPPKGLRLNSLTTLNAGALLDQEETDVSTQIFFQV